MSQRGGSVATHVRVAPTARDPPAHAHTPRHGADLVLAFEPGEAVRAYGYLARGGALVCSTRPLVPSAAATSGYDGRAQVDWLAEHVGPERFAALDVQALEDAGLSPKCLNVLLLGAAVGLGALPFGADELRRAMAELMKPKLIPMNERALELGDLPCGLRRPMRGVGPWAGLRPVPRPWWAPGSWWAPVRSPCCALWAAARTPTSPWGRPRRSRR